MLNGAVKLKTVTVDTDAYNLIPSRFPPVGLYDRLEGVLGSSLAALENLTNPRLKEKRRLTGATAADAETAPRFQNWNHAPFTYENPEGSTFFGRWPGALELSEELETALAVAVAKRGRFLRRTREVALELDMRVFKRRVRGTFLDCTDRGHELSRPECLDLGRQAMNDNVAGLVYHSPERASGRRLAIIDATTLSRVDQTKHFRFVWDGERISKVYDFERAETIEPSELAGPIVDTAA